MTNHSKARRTGTALRRLAALGALTTATLLAAPAAAQLPDPARGRALYENHCIACHTERIHSRPVRIALTREALREIVEHWRRQQNLAWSAQDTEDVVEFLGRTRYKFPSPVARQGRP
jgi:mono/diheme cytochrome c family protein